MFSKPCVLKWKMVSNESSTIWNQTYKHPHSTNPKGKHETYRVKPHLTYHMPCQITHIHKTSEKSLGQQSNLESVRCWSVYPKPMTTSAKSTHTDLERETTTFGWPPPPTLYVLCALLTGKDFYWLALSWWPTFLKKEGFHSVASLVLYKKWKRIVVYFVSHCIWIDWIISLVTRDEPLP